MTKREGYRRIIERLKKEGRLPSLKKFVDAMVEGRSEYGKRIAAWEEYHQIGPTDTKTDTSGLDRKTSDNEKHRNRQRIM